MSDLRAWWYRTRAYRAWSRVALAWHVLRGRPAIVGIFFWRTSMNIVTDLCAAEGVHVKVNDCTFFKSDGEKAALNFMSLAEFERDGLDPLVSVDRE